MKPVAAVIALVVVLALSPLFAPRSGHAGSTATQASSTLSASPVNKNCPFVRNHLPCPCPKAQKARALANAARITAGAIGTVMGTTTAALAQPEHKSR